MLLGCPRTLLHCHSVFIFIIIINCIMHQLFGIHRFELPFQTPDSEGERKSTAATITRECCLPRPGLRALCTVPRGTFLRGVPNDASQA